MRREDPLGRQRPEYKRNVAVEREGTRKPVQPKTVTDRGRDPSPGKPRRDPYMPSERDVAGYDKRFQEAARVFEAADRRAQAAKKGRRK